MLTIIPIIVSTIDTTIAKKLSEDVAIDFIFSSVQVYRIRYTGQ